jgi:hypothetical protein
MVPIESDAHVQRARRTAAWARGAIGLAGIALILAKPSLLGEPAIGIAGFATIAATAGVQLLASRVKLLKLEESLAGIAAVLIVGFGDQRVGVLSILWLAAVASGVMARGGRVHWIGRTIVLSALVPPIVRDGSLSAEYAGLVIASIALLLTIGRLTVELNSLLRRARWDADHDGLTGLLSRNAFHAALQRASAAAREQRPLSLLMLARSTRRPGRHRATRCSHGSASCCRRSSRAAPSAAASAATSSRCCFRRRTRSRWPIGCCGRCRRAARRSGASRRRSASRRRRATEATRRRCCAPPTSPCASRSRRLERDRSRPIPEDR